MKSKNEVWTGIHSNEERLLIHNILFEFRSMFDYLDIKDINFISRRNRVDKLLSEITEMYDYDERRK